MVTAGPPLRVHALIDSLVWGGAEALLADLAKAAPNAGIELSVGYLFDEEGSPAAARLRNCDVEPVLVPVTGLVKPSALLSVRRHLAALQPDVVHTHLGYADLLGGLAARSLRLPVVSSIHEMEWEAGLRERVKLQLMAAVRRRCAARVVSVSQAARLAFLRGGRDAPERVVTVHNGVAAEARPGAGRRVRAELGLSSSETVVAMVSVIRPGKGHELALRAVEALREQSPDVRLLVVGDGPGRTLLERQARQLRDAVILAGHRDDVMEVLDAADVLIHPSRIDAFPTALLEAMAAGVPVVASAVGGIPEIVEDGVTGALVDAPPQVTSLVDVLRPLVKDPVLRARLGKQARARFEREFTADRWAQRLREIYEVAVAAKQG